MYVLHSSSQIPENTDCHLRRVHCCNCFQDLFQYFNFLWYLYIFLILFPCRQVVVLDTCEAVKYSLLVSEKKKKIGRGYIRSLVLSRNLFHPKLKTPESVLSGTVKHVVIQNHWSSSCTGIYGRRASSSISMQLFCTLSVC